MSCATSQHRSTGCAKRGGRPVTWIGGGGMDPKKLAGLGVPALRSLFADTFGEQTASNNAGWLRRKLAEPKDCVHGQRRSPIVRARDLGAAIWNSQGHCVTDGGCSEDDGSAGAGGCGQGQGEDSMDGCASHLSGSPYRRSIKRSAPGTDSPPSTSGSGGSVSPRYASSTPSQYRSGRVSAKPAAAPGGGRHHASPRTSARAAAQRAAAVAQAQAVQVQAQAGGSGPGPLISEASLSDARTGLGVMVFWPGDATWYGATICALDAAAQSMRLLYSDTTEESVSGQDFAALLANGHLALAPGVVAPGAALAEHAALLPAPGQLACGEGSLFSCDSFGPAEVQALWPDEPAALRGGGGRWLSAGSRSQGCLLLAEPGRLERSQSGGACASGSAGSGCDELEGLPVKRACYEASTSLGSGSRCDTSSAPQQDAQSQPQELQLGASGGSGAPQLPCWFAGPERGQLVAAQQQLGSQAAAGGQASQQAEAHLYMQIGGEALHLHAPGPTAAGVASSLGLCELQLTAGAAIASTFATAPQPAPAPAAAPRAAAGSLAQQQAAAGSLAGTPAGAAGPQSPGCVPQPSAPGSPSSSGPSGGRAAADSISQLRELQQRLHRALSDGSAAMQQALAGEAAPARSPRASASGGGSGGAHSGALPACEPGAAGEAAGLGACVSGFEGGCFEAAGGADELDSLLPSPGEDDALLTLEELGMPDLSGLGAGAPAGCYGGLPAGACEAAFSHMFDD